MIGTGVRGGGSRCRKVVLDGAMFVDRDKRDYDRAHRADRDKTAVGRSVSRSD
jgi:hypothetical protein